MNTSNANGFLQRQQLL